MQQKKCASCGRPIERPWSRRRVWHNCAGTGVCLTNLLSTELARFHCQLLLFLLPPKLQPHSPEACEHGCCSCCNCCLPMGGAVRKHRLKQTLPEQPGNGSVGNGRKR
jgi:hypothetical protein